jgi:hypothetical protein
MSEEISKPVFDSARPIEIKLKSAEGVKAIPLRFPTDAEWIDRQKQRKIVTKDLGRGMSETIMPYSGEYDLDLVGKLRTDQEGPSIDRYEATKILDQLGRCDVEEVTEEGGSFRVCTRVPGGTTVHILRMPSAKDMMQHRRAYCRSLDMPYNQRQMTVNLAAGGKTYSKLEPKSEGYGSPVPIIHQAAAVNAAIAAMEFGIGDADTENF